MRRAAGIVVVIGLIVAGVVWIAGRGPREESAALEPGKAQASGLATEADPEPIAPSLEPQATGRESVTAAKTAPDESDREQAAPAEGARVQVDGTLIVVDENGVPHPALDGTLELHLWRADSADNMETPVRAGQWSIEVDEEVELGVVRMTLAGREAVLEDGPMQRFPVDTGPIELRARWPARVVLNVVDDATSAPLSGLTVRTTNSWTQRELGHPGEEPGELMVRDGRSPLTLEPTRHQALNRDSALMVRAPGHAWGRIQIDMSAGGERELRLPREAQLELFLTGAAPHEQAVLRLYDTADERPFVELLVEDRERIELDAMTPGSYEARVEVGDWWGPPLVQAGGDVELIEGEVARLTLEIEPSPELRLAPLSGVVVVPVEWGLSQSTLTLELRDTPLDGDDGRRAFQLTSLPHVKGEQGARRFELSDVQLGTYELTLNELEFSILFDLPEGGRDDVRLEVPPPAEVIVEIVDELTGLPVKSTSLHWHCERDGGGGLNDEMIDPETGTCEFRAPQCRIQLGSWSDLYQPWNEILEVGPGVNRITVRARPCSSVKLRLMDGETPVPWDGNWYPDKEALEGPGKVVALASSSGIRTLRLSEPGPYVLHLPLFTGFEPVPPQEVVAVMGEEVELRVQLVRAQ